MKSYILCTSQNLQLDSIPDLKTVMELEKMVANVMKKNQELASDIARLKHDMKAIRIRNENLRHDIENYKSLFQEHLNGMSDKTKLETMRDRLEYLEAITKQISECHMFSPLCYVPYVFAMCHM